MLLLRLLLMCSAILREILSLFWKRRFSQFSFYFDYSSSSSSSSCHRRRPGHFLRFRALSQLLLHILLQVTILICLMVQPALFREYSVIIFLGKIFVVLLKRIRPKYLNLLILFSVSSVIIVFSVNFIVS